MKKIGIALLCMAFLATACGQRTVKDQSATKAEVTEIDSDGFYSRIMDARSGEYIVKRPAVIDFYATWCGPCQTIAPIMEKLADEYDGRVDFYKVDVDQARELAISFGVQSIPMIYYIPVDGEPEYTLGAMEEEDYRDIIEKVLLGNRAAE